MKNFRKYLKTLLNGFFSSQHSKEFSCSFLWKNRITHTHTHTQKSVCGDASLCRVSVMLVVKFYPEIFYKSRFFKHIETVLSEITKKQPVIFNTVVGSEHRCISYRIFSNFSCVLLLSSVLTFSVHFSPHFCRYEVKMLFDIRLKR